MATMDGDALLKLVDELQRGFAPSQPPRSKLPVAKTKRPAAPVPSSPTLLSPISAKLAGMKGRKLERHTAEPPALAVPRKAIAGPSAQGTSSKAPSSKPRSTSPRRQPTSKRTEPQREKSAGRATAASEASAAPTTVSEASDGLLPLLPLEPAKLVPGSSMSVEQVRNLWHSTTPLDLQLSLLLPAVRGAGEPPFSSALSALSTACLTSSQLAVLLELRGHAVAALREDVRAVQSALSQASAEMEPGNIKAVQEQPADALRRAVQEARESLAATYAHGPALVDLPMIHKVIDAREQQLVRALQQRNADEREQLQEEHAHLQLILPSLMRVWTERETNLRTLVAGVSTYHSRLEPCRAVAAKLAAQEAAVKKESDALSEVERYVQSDTWPKAMQAALAAAKAEVQTVMKAKYTKQLDIIRADTEALVQAAEASGAERLREATMDMERHQAAEFEAEISALETRLRVTQSKRVQLQERLVQVTERLRAEQELRRLKAQVRRLWGTLRLDQLAAAFDISLPALELPAAAVPTAPASKGAPSGTAEVAPSNAPAAPKDEQQAGSAQGGVRVRTAPQRKGTFTITVARAGGESEPASAARSRAASIVSLASSVGVASVSAVDTAADARVELLRQATERSMSRWLGEVIAAVPYNSDFLVCLHVAAKTAQRQAHYWQLRQPVPPVLTLGSVIDRIIASAPSRGGAKQVGTPAITAAAIAADGRQEEWITATEAAISRFLAPAGMQS